MKYGLSIWFPTLALTAVLFGNAGCLSKKEPERMGDTKHSTVNALCLENNTGMEVQARYIFSGFSRSAGVLSPHTAATESFLPVDLTSPVRIEFTKDDSIIAQEVFQPRDCWPMGQFDDVTLKYSLQPNKTIILVFDVTFADGSSKEFSYSKEGSVE